jgi:nitrite reductase/ring-hydroxylating ferredoxin subunit/uncharacterized membrane protein
MLALLKDLVARQAWLDAIGDPLQKSINGIYRRGRITEPLQNFLNGVWIGHPLHPLITDMPIGAWTATAVLDGVGLATGQQSLQTAANITLATGLAGAVGAAVTGFTDWKDTYGEGKKTGLFHGLAMVATVVLYTASLIVRLTSSSGRSSRGSVGTGLGYAGYAVMAFGSYFGGEEVFDLGSGVNRTAFLQSGPHDFVAVMAAADLKVGEPSEADAKGVPILLVNTGSQVYALHDTCVHLGCSLATGSLKEDSIVCPCHGSQFDLLNGRVINGPATMPQPHFEVRNEGGMIEVRLATP